ncbi:MAG: nucleotidyltransferase domain-containing protein [Gammaproteobacteria bacterium]|jgi:predicted nucleotidyltransferase|nr:nucleotidyltransferase domain-containing protein [Gammaproteobacteria bacterium]MBT4606330.1 nucleotidyltransferase domain-containing protein [Thiotrichales bacterium]MBT3472490.1 nucleotidyltransferase domain-containing protein [Gammaproteobacteria bacterium]MBT3966042.1 nucleotidyltransferase domain-containing protein [Gammaproteobacteria bacterium]MBT4079449.1 nucleotidyltransferase domain-containing protein [Gammaproteobacteria bacterium]
MKQETLQKLTDTIVGTVHPEQVILFGSHARGEQGKDSDVDLLIVESEAFDENRSRKQEIIKIYRQLRWVRFPVDVLVYSKAEFDYWKQQRNHVIAQAAREGQVLYAS